MNSTPAAIPVRWLQYINSMKIRSELILVIFMCSCVYDPPPKGKELTIHNQTEKPIVVRDSLTADYFKLYDTAKVNGRKYIRRKDNFLTEFNVVQLFYTDVAMDLKKIKSNGKIRLYFIDEAYMEIRPEDILKNQTYRFIDIHVDTLNKYQLNHVFFTSDTILFEHDMDYYTNWTEK